MLNNILTYLTFVLLPFGLTAQTCNFTLSGEIVDETTMEPMAFANVYISELEKGVISDERGAFLFENLCSDSFHLKISHVGCETQMRFLTIRKDTHLHILLDHNSHLLEELAITSRHEQETTQAIEQIGEARISENADKNLGMMIQNIAGVSVIKNGNGIAKPVVHGLYGNRLTILNNGIPQNGQQWGTDHAPEIDPQSSNTISVYKGVSTLEYAGNSLGSVILLSPNSIPDEPHVHGKASYFFEANGNGNGTHVQMQKHGEFMAWRANTTYKRRGDMSTPTYYLTNTGNEEINGSLQLEKRMNRFEVSLYGSTFNTTIGVLRGAHIGNLTDLEFAMQREQPYFTKDYFSFDINAPYQKVNHQLGKAFIKFQPSDSIFIQGTYAYQLNKRKEFDVRRKAYKDKPSLSLDQGTHFVELKYKQYFKNKLTLKAGYQFMKTDNFNIPETSLLPLIPDYISYENGYFFMLRKEAQKFTFETGARIDTEWRSVITIKRNIERDRVRYRNTYHNYGISSGITFHAKHNLEIGYNIGLAGRNPEVNELYSQGVHQGVGAIEEGDPNLQPEQSIKNLLNIKYSKNNKWFFDIVAYHQYVDNFIYLNPSGEIRLTIRGAFPVFNYQQANATLFGADFATTYVFNNSWSTTLKYSFLQGDNLSDNLPLINMPPNNMMANLKYELPEIWRLKNLSIEVSNQYIFEQKHFVEGQDFVNPPTAYYLLGATMRTERHFRRNSLTLYLRGENLLNTAYRDYLNRWRYFANDTGINLVLGVEFKF